MEKTEIIELNGKEYEAVLNRDSFARIDRVCNVNKTMYEGNKPSYEFLNEIPEDYNPMEDISMDKILEQEEERLNSLKKLISMTFFILLYPKHQLKPAEVKEMLEPYFEDEEKINKLCVQAGNLLQKCIEIKDDAIREYESKNLKAQINKKK